MSKSEQEKPIICIEHEYDGQYEKSTNQSPIDLQKQPELPVSCKRWENTYTAYHISEKFVVIEINSTDTLVKIEYPWRSKPLHIHIIEHLCPVCSDLYDNWKVCGHTIFVIFNDHILRIHLENEISGSSSSFKECKTDFSFRISETESSFKIIEDDEHECLRACLVLDERCWKKVELFEICLFRDDERLFGKMKENFFRLPPNITGIEIIWENDYVVLTMTLNSEGNSLELPIYIYDRKTDKTDDTDSIFLLNECERCILATSDQLDRFQTIGFQIVATIYVCPFEDHDDFPEIQKFIKVMLEELNKYHRSQWDSDCGSDSD
jgi:hypothetical protein